MKNIVVIFTGGTFSMKIDEKTGGAIPHFHGEDLIALMPEASKLANLSIYNFGNRPGPHMTPNLMFDLSKIAQKEIDKDNVDGLIITHGTDTLEETAYFLDLTVQTEKPIVVIGAMRTSTEPDWDGPRNLIDAIYIINEPNSKNMGVLVCLNGEINAASEVTKTHTENIETFRSLNFGELGFVQNGRVIYNRLPKVLEKIPADKIDNKVDLLEIYAGMDDKFFRYSADSGISALVVEALGVGNVPPKVFEGIKYVVEKGIPVILVSRCPAGETLDVYSYEGAGKWLKGLGVIFAEYLNGQKARIKTIIALGKTNKVDELRELFE